jgi:cytochrome c oxidase cbb3-type subunit 1
MPSQWYLFGGLLAFPWLFAVAQLLLVASPVRGIMQEVVNNWYSRGFINLWLGSIGLAALFYFVPKFSGKPIYSRALAIFGFWLLFIFGSWGGMSAGAPVPRWLSSLGVVTHVMTAVAVLAVATNLFQTLQQKANGSRSDRLLRFPVLGAAAYVISSLLSIAGQLPAVGRVTDFTLYGLGVSNLFLYGFFALSVSGAIYHVAPRLTGAELPRPGLVNFHFWTAVIGAALVSIPLIAGGVAQGQAFGNPEIPFLQIVRSSIPFLGMSTLGGVLILAGFTACAINLIGLVVRGCAECCRGAAPSRLKPSAAGASL